MKSKLYLIFFLFVFQSCQNVEKTKKPADLIPEDKMVEVLTEISIMTSARNFNKRQFENTGIKPEVFIYEKFDIDSLQFERSNNYYAENYTTYENIYSRVKENLMEMKDKFDSLRDVERKRKDSLLAVEKNLDSVQIDSLNIRSDSIRVEQEKRLDSLQSDTTLIHPRSIEIQ